MYVQMSVAAVVFIAITLCVFKVFGRGKRTLWDPVPLSVKILAVTATWVAVVSAVGIILAIKVAPNTSWTFFKWTTSDRSNMLVISVASCVAMTVLSLSLWGTVLHWRPAYYVAVGILALIITAFVVAGFIPVSESEAAEDVGGPFIVALLLALPLYRIVQKRRDFLQHV